MLFTKHTFYIKRHKQVEIADGNSYTRLTGTKGVEVAILKSNKIEFKTKLLLEEKQDII